MAFVDGYPDTTLVDEPDNRRPIFTNRHIDDPQGLAPNLPEPIGAEDLDILQVLKSDADACLCSEQWLENSMFESSPSSKPKIAADNSDIDNFLREYRENSKSGSKSAQDPKNGDEHSGSAMYNNSGFLAALINSNDFATSSNYMATVSRNSDPFSTPEKPEIDYPVPNTANVGGSMVYGYLKPGRIEAAQYSNKMPVSTTKVPRNSIVPPNSRVARTPNKTNMRRHPGTSMASPGDVRAHRHRIGKSTPVSRRWAMAAPSILIGELSSKPSDANNDGASTESETTTTNSSKSRENSGSPESSSPDTPRGPPPARKDPPTSGAGGSTTRRRLDAMNGNGPQAQSGPPSENGGSGSNANGSGQTNYTRYHSRERYVDFQRFDRGDSGAETLGDGFDAMNGMSGFPMDSYPLQPCRPPPPYASAIHNGPMHSPTAYIGSIMENGSLPRNGAAMQNGPMPQNISLTYGSQIQGGPVLSNGVPMRTGTMPPNSAPMQNVTVPMDVPLMHHEPMPAYAPSMQNTVPQNGSIMQNGPVTQYFLPIQNYPMPQYSFPLQYGSMPSYGPLMDNGQVPFYGPPFQNGSAPSYGSGTDYGSAPSYASSTNNGSMPSYGLPTHNGPMPSYGLPMHIPPWLQSGRLRPNSAPMHNGPMPAYGPQFENGMVPEYDPLMQNPLTSTTNDGHFVDLANGKVLIPRNGFKGNDAYGKAFNGKAPGGKARKGESPKMQTPNGQGPIVQPPKGDNSNNQIVNGLKGQA
ncbi:hypothetical protein V493_05756 [Pseudogymnoascus sp. VKM F-4281 (FW-2241)]|nr:hypothetical protein V493_05756 [Pseudogymnoascus sp. VKM F-4281 (FW-2241)]